MKILIGIAHPAHVHFYKNFIWEMKKTGHTVDIICRDRDIVAELLDRYGFEYFRKSIKPKSDKLFDPLSYINYPRYEYETYKFVKKCNPDVVTAVGGTTMSHISTITDTLSVGFIDNEDRHVFSNKFTVPFLDFICTPDNFTDDYNGNHIRYSGYHELAYLHPNRFTPNTKNLEEYDVDIGERYFVLRFVAWEAAHDITQFGFSKKDKRILVKKLSEFGKVYITSESELPPVFEKYRLPIPPHLIHDFLYHSNLYLGDSQTMATESALLGIPAIRCNSFVGENDMSNFLELENKYELLYNFRHSNKAIKKAVELAQEEKIKEIWDKRLTRVLEDKIDVTKFMVHLFEKIENTIQ